MRLLGRGGLQAQAWVYRSDEDQIRLRIGGFHFIMSADEAISIARQLVTAVDTARRAAQRAQGDDEDGG